MMPDARGFGAGAGGWRRFVVLGLLVLVAWGGVQGQGDGDKGGGGRALQDFSLSISPASGNVVQDSSRTYTVEASVESDGFDDEISLSISGLGTGVTGTFAGTLSSTDTSTTLTVSASRTAALTTRNFTVTGTADNGLTRTVSGSVTVTVRQPTSLSITPSEVGIGECYTISAGNAANMTLDLQYSQDGGAT